MYDEHYLAAVDRQTDVSNLSPPLLAIEIGQHVPL